MLTNLGLLNQLSTDRPAGRVILFAMWYACHVFDTVLFVVVAHVAGLVVWIGIHLRPSNRIQIRNLPAEVSKDDIDLLVSAYGTVKKSQLGTHSRLHSFSKFTGLLTKHQCN